MRSALAGLVFCYLAVASAVPGLAETPGKESGAIREIQVSRDARKVWILSEGPIGRHIAFAMKNPNRLVVDFEGTRLGEVPLKTPVGTGSVKEIRVGYQKSKARVVIDFGDNAMPKYKIHAGSNSVVIAFQAEQAPAAGVSSKKKPSAGPRVAAKPATVPKTPLPGKKAEPTLSMKSAEMRDGLIVIELVNPKNVNGKYRLVLEVDPAGLRFVRAAMSDDAGNLRSWNMSGSSEPGEHKEARARLTRGPRKAAIEEARPAAKPERLQWGRPSVEPKGPTALNEASNGPVRPEQVILERRPGDGQG